MKLNRRSAIPLYYQLKEIIRDKIMNGEWKEGDDIPSETTLAEDFEISRATVRQALGELVSEGMLTRKRGKGTYVCNRKGLRDLTGDLSFARQMEQKGLKPSSILLFAGLSRVSSRIAGLLGISPETMLCKIDRVRLADDEPLLFETICVPPNWASGILEQELSSLAVFQFIEEKQKIRFTEANTSIQPIFTDQYEAKLLGVKAGLSSLLIETVASHNKEPIVFSRRIARGDRCTLFVEYQWYPKGDDWVNAGLTLNTAEKRNTTDQEQL